MDMSKLSKEALELKLAHEKEMVSHLLGRLKITGLDVSSIESLVKDNEYSRWHCTEARDFGAVGLSQDLEEVVRAEAEYKLELLNDLISYTRSVASTIKEIKEA